MVTGLLKRFARRASQHSTIKKTLISSRHDLAFRIFHIGSEHDLCSALLNAPTMNQESGNPFVRKVLLRQSIGSVRLVIALFTVTAAVTKVLYDRLLPELNDLDAVRWMIIGTGSLLFIITYLPFKKGVFVAYSSLFLYASTLLYVIAFVLINRFDPNAVTILILVLGASSVIFNSLSYYAVQCGIIILASAVTSLSWDLGNENLIAFLNLIMALGVFGIVITVRLKLILSVKNSHSDLEKLNVLSIVANKAGEIVFISPSVRNLLGYDPHDLLKNGWWSSKNLRDGWISKDYILNYPNMMPKELMTMETCLLNKEGKQVWFSWSNSMLPNGNYVGLGLDITKYKYNEIFPHPIIHPKLTSSR
jgi:PAS domain S-box-containing protein